MEHLDGIVLPISNRRNVYQVQPQMVTIWVRAFKAVLASKEEAVDAEDLVAGTR